MQKKKRYNDNDHNNALRYYLLGLTLAEISKLMDIPLRTLQKWQRKGNWVDCKKIDNVKLKAKDLKQSGFSIKRISEILKISNTTVWRYCK
ncbi:hypothetical protein GSF70_03475 [Flavobacteriaceae bacterium W22]|nr:hypothetical protein [Flavobacteriaceae bacterium W22]